MIKGKLNHGVLFVVMISMFLSCSPHIEKLEKLEKLEVYTKYIQDNYLTPEDYILSKFDNHNIVIIGEYHRIKHDVILIQNLIPELYKAGIYNVAIEFALYEDQNLIDKLITAKEYDQELAQKINLNAFLSMGLGGFKEYIDIFKTVWELNQSLPRKSKKMRIIGINDKLNWSYIKTEDDRHNHELRKRVFENFSEQNWADRVKKEVIDKGEKVLCYCGMHHAFSKYHQPYVNEKGLYITSNANRFGNYLYNYFKDEVFTISTHYPWPPIEGYNEKAVLPADGVLDYVLAKLPKEQQRFGFDVFNSPMGNLKLKTSLYKYGYKNFTLKDFCDGYVCQGRFTEYEGVTPIMGFINSENINEVQKKFSYPFNKWSAKKTNLLIALEANMVKEWAEQGILKDAKKIYNQRY